MTRQISAWIRLIFLIVFSYIFVVLNDINLIISYPFQPADSFRAAQHRIYE